jgi:hypothetical protein
MYETGGVSLTDHPLNRGRVMWWAQTPEVAHGWYQYDLTGTRCRGTNLNPLTSEIDRNVRQSPVPGLLSRIVVESVATNRNTFEADKGMAGLGVTSQGSTAVWIRFFTTSGNAFACGEFLPAGLGGADHDIGTIARLGTQWFTRWTNSGGTRVSIQTGSVAANTWYRVVSTYDGVNVRLWVNGVQIGTGPALTGTLYTNAAARWVMGKRGQQNGSTLDGYWCDQSIWNRALSQIEVYEDYRQGLQGYPDVLKRRDSVLIPLFVQPAGGFLPAWAVGSNQYLGGGYAS